ncbi:MAG: 50S ribosomal protein L24 [Chitinophagales bacterium]|nr:50S ribosomal protein L24 [Bacteroidota bacterium]MCB9042854.1 50S ribosomal protein L24 [Chitinophagales bacterium]
MKKNKNIPSKFHIRKGDTVQVIAGEDKGKQGKVLEVITAKYRAIVEGVNIQIKHQKPNAAFPNGGRIEKEGSVHISNLMLVDPSSGKPTRIGRKEHEGKIFRYAKKSGEVIK